jgi:alkanesulfonate monooxygenase SsuD/methylene tetrahydromethanopterin reductase-like flavin-dependent oxidoreductase (luciferase family)
MTQGFPAGPLEFGIFDWIEASELPAAQVYGHKLDIAEKADQAGFWGWHIAEHQGTPLSIDVSPALLLAAAIQRTRRLRMGALTFCLPWYDPYRFYGEICMLDQMSGGRLELGVGRGVSPIESALMGIGSIEESRSRYRETLEIFFAACRGGPLVFKGKYRSYDGMELHVRPLQRPYPPLWFPSSDAKPLFERYRELWVKHRDEPGRHNGHVAAPKLAKLQHVYVADSEAEAMKVGFEAFQVWADHIHYLTRKRGLPDLMKNLNPVSKTSVQRFIGGTAESVRQQLEEMVRDSGINYLLLVFSYGNLKPDAAMRSMDLFVRDVMPALRAKFTKI